MSATKPTDIPSQIEEAQREELKRYAEEHGQNIARAIEAFARTIVMVRGLQETFMRHRIGLTEDMPRNIMMISGGYADFMLSAVCTFLNLTQEQVDLAGTEALKMVDKIVDLIGDGKVDDKPENDHAAVSKPGIQLVH